MCLYICLENDKFGPLLHKLLSHALTTKSFYINYIFIVLCTYTIQSNNCPDSYVIPEYYQSQFEEKRKKLHILITKMIKILKKNNISLNGLKYFLSLRPVFRDAARAAKSIEEAMIVISDHTSLINTKHQHFARESQ